MADIKSFKDLVGKRLTKEVDFLGSKVKIQKLTVAEVLEIQERAKQANEKQDDLLGVVKFVIQASVVGADEVSTEEFDQFPMEDLSKLSNDIMKFSGITGNEKA